MSRRSVLTLGTSAVLLAGALFALPRADGFPHAEHAGLFPLCIGCHEGVPQENRATSFPPPSLCAGCHNGTDQPRVDWRGPSDYASNLRFSHSEHDRREQLECTACHARAGQPDMSVQRAPTQQCFACHTHRAEQHLVAAPCMQCHVPLAQTRFAARRVEALPKPPAHERPDFLQRAHGQLAQSERQRCEVCHTRERCAACHVDAAQRAEVNAMLPAGGQLELPRMTARYFVPESHESERWLAQHGAAAQTRISDCASCHTRESCATCHAAQAPRVISSLPRRASVTAPGVATVRRRPPSHSAPFFNQQHGTVGATGGQSCTACHTRASCESCHSSTRAVRASAAPTGATPGRPQARASAYHPANFMERHASPAYNRSLECSNCHDAARFCRDCHERRGMGTSGRLDPGFHNAQPLFLLNHGKPARQSLESCASCHKQTDCMQCHSGLGAFRVSPHGPGFDARRLQERNARMCFACHLSDPLGRSQP